MKYKVLITDIAKEDIKEKKKYILRNFKYREYAEYFSRKIKKAVQELIHCRTVMELPVSVIGDMIFI